MRRSIRVSFAALVVGLAAIAVPIAAAPSPALANETGGLYLSPNNASDPDMEQCSFQGVNGYCMYTSQDLNQGGNYPMSNTLGFFSTWRIFRDPNGKDFGGVGFQAETRGDPLDGHFNDLRDSLGTKW